MNAGKERDEALIKVGRELGKRSAIRPLNAQGRRNFGELHASKDATTDRGGANQMMKLLGVVLTAASVLMSGLKRASDETGGEPGPAERPAPPAAKRPADPKARPIPGTVVYRSSFDKGKQDGWSSNKALPLDKAGSMLRPLHNQTVRLDLPKIPPHKFLHLRLDLYVIGTWDGHGAHAGDGDAPDTITIKLAGGRTLLHASFAVVANCVQSYPDGGLWARHPARAGALKYLERGQQGQSLYRLALTFPHADRKAVLEFAASLTEEFAQNRNVGNECWGLGSVVVSALAKAPVRLDEKRFGRLWGDLAKKDPVAASKAVWTLISAGKDASGHIERELRPPVDKGLAKKVAELIPQLDDNQWRVRRKATDVLKGLGKGAYPLLRRALAGNPSPEVRSRIEEVLSAHEGSAGVQMRAGRARWVLQVIGGEKAAAMLKALPPPKDMKRRSTN